MIRIFIGVDYREMVAAHVLMHSIMARTSQPVAITPITVGMLPLNFTRKCDSLATNEFSDLRFLVPFFCNYKGHAIFMDCDMLVRADIAGLWNRRDDEHAVQVVKHNHTPLERTKYLGTHQTSYPKKNWSSVMLFNNAKCKQLTPEYVNQATGLELHQFKWLENDDQIGDLPKGWNHLIGYDDPEAERIYNVHFTTGGPYFHNYNDVPFAAEWHAEREAMTHCSQTHYPNIDNFRRKR